MTGCTSGTDDSVPPTLRALEEMNNPSGNWQRATPTPAAPIAKTGIYQVEFITTEGKFVVEVNREWAPIGADRFYKLVQDQFFDDAAFFRVISGFMAQFGLPADPSDNRKWSDELKDEPVIQGNKRGFLTFAKSSRKDSRTTQMFINFGDNSRLDADGFSAFGQVIEGMDVVDSINSEYGESPDQSSVKRQGNAYLHSQFPNLSYIQTARITKDDLAADAANE